jgi:formylglycine-generating enzyme required for sulfatase activity
MKTPWLPLLFVLLSTLPATAIAGARKALVIGNAAYSGAPLKNPVNDARSLEKALVAIGFAVSRHEDLKKKDLRKAVNAFVDGLGADDTALVFYAGHGIEMKGENYLLPVDFAADNEDDAAEDACRMQTLLDRLSSRPAAVNIIILDACRNDPFSRKWSRSAGGRGFRIVDVSAGSFVAFSAAPGKTAADAGGGANSPFTSSLIKHLATPGLDINDVLRKVRADVLAATGQKQNPWSMDNLTGGFRFASAAVGGTVPPVPGGGIESTDVPPATRDTAETLRDESRREEEARKQWGEWRKKMKAAFDEAVAQERKDLAAETKARWFESFLTDYAGDDPTSTDDERLRADAQGRAEKWRGEVAAAGAAPPSVPSRGGLTWVRFPGGTFQMGSGIGDEGPIHGVTVRAFELTRTEITNAQYQACVDAGACSAPHFDDKTCWVSIASATGQNVIASGFRAPNRPVVCVDWEEAHAFANWVGGRLPTESEWEYAARDAGKNIEYPWGDETASCRRAVMDDGGNGCGTNLTAEVCSRGEFAGLCDMSGNVWEWVEDAYLDSYAGAPTDGSARLAPAGAGRVTRGGSMRSPSRDVRVRDREAGHLGVRGAGLGFRLVR